MRAASTGTIVKPTTSEQAWQNTTTRASDWNSEPLVDCMNTRGRNTTQVVRVEASIAPATSEAPTDAASSGGIAVFLALAHDVFQDHDGVVDHHAHPQRQTAEGHLVEGQAAEVEQARSRR